MATISPPEFPPAHGVTVGGSALRPQADWPLYLLIVGVALVVAGLAPVPLLALAGIRPIRAEDGTALAALAINASILGVLYVDTRLDGPVVRLSASAIEVTAGSYSSTIPWSGVVRLWMVGSGSAFPVLCIATDQPSRFAPAGVGWRLKAYASRRLFGTPLAVPLTSTGLSESGLREAVQCYRDGPGGAGSRGPGRANDAQGGVDRRFRGLLIAALAMPTGSVLAAVWGGVAAQARVEIGWWSVALLMVVASATTAVTAVSVATLYTALAPPGITGLRLPKPLLRIGADGVEHIIRGRARRVPWAAVARVYPARDRAGRRYLCVATADPSALLPPAYRSIRARRNQRRFGAPVAVPLAGSWCAEDDLLAAVRCFSGGLVATDCA